MYVPVGGLLEVLETFALASLSERYAMTSFISSTYLYVSARLKSLPKAFRKNINGYMV